LSLTFSRLNSLNTVHLLHGEDKFSVDLADRNGNPHIGLVKNSIGLDGCESGCKEDLCCDGIVVKSGSACLRSTSLRSTSLRSTSLRSTSLRSTSLRSTSLRSTSLRSASLGSARLNLSRNLLPEHTATETSASDTCSSSTTKVTCSTSGVLENTTLSNSNGDLTVWWDAHGLHHLLDADGIDYRMLAPLIFCGRAYILGIWITVTCWLRSGVTAAKFVITE
jgi:hypothetical protein